MSTRVVNIHERLKTALRRTLDEARHEGKHWLIVRVDYEAYETLTEDLLRDLGARMFLDREDKGYYSVAFML